MIDWPKRWPTKSLSFAGFDQASAGVADGPAARAPRRHVQTRACSRRRGHQPANDPQGPRAFGQPDGLAWSVRGFGPIRRATARCGNLPGQFALAASDRATAERALAGMIRAARSGGPVVLHLLNLWRLDDGPVDWQKCLVLDVPQGKSLVVKGVQRVGDRGFVHLVVAPLAAPGEFQSESAPLLSFEVESLRQAALAAGASKVQFYGNHRFQPFDRQTSVDLIMVAEK